MKFRDDTFEYTPIEKKPQIEFLENGIIEYELKVIDCVEYNMDNRKKKNGETN